MIDLKPFCNPKRKNMAQPFTQGDKTIATDGCGIVRVPRDPSVFDGDVPEAPSPEAVAHAFKKAAPFTHLVPLPAFQVPSQVDCKPCKGQGKIIECPGCKGKGETECCECEQTRACPECKGHGEMPGDGASCLDCGGSGKVPPEASVRLGRGLYVDLRYILLIKDLPGLKIGTSRNGPEDFRPVPFTFDGGGEGLLMPMSRPFTRVIEIKELVKT